MSGEPDPKVKKRGPRKKPRHVATRAEWKRIQEAKRGPCRACQADPDDANAGPFSYHHLVDKSLLGDDVPQNVVMLGGTGSMYCHGIYTSHMPGADCKGRWRTWEQIAAAIRAGLQHEEESYIVAKKGPGFLARYYPEGT